MQPILSRLSQIGHTNCGEADSERAIHGVMHGDDLSFLVVNMKNVLLL